MRDLGLLKITAQNNSAITRICKAYYGGREHLCMKKGCYFNFGFSSSGESFVYIFTSPATL